MDIVDLPRPPATRASSAPLNRGVHPAFFSTQVVDARRFYLNLASSHASELYVVCAGYEQCLAEYKIDRRSFPYHSFEVVSHGSGSLELGGKQTTLFPGVVFSYGPGVAHQIRADAANPLGKYFVNFSGRYAGPLLTSCELPPGSVIHTAHNSEILNVLDVLIHDGGSGADNAGDLCRKLLEYLLQKIKVAKRTNETSQSQAEQTYERCRSYIFENSARLMSLEATAHECNIDKAYLCRLFRRFHHQTPYQYLINQKMHKAAVSLENHDLRVSEVASSLGYADAFLFSRTFKGVFGVSPSEFRRLRGS